MFYSETSKPEEFIRLCEECMSQMKQGTLDDDLLNQLKKRYFAQGVRSMNSFDDIAISFCRSYFTGIDYFKTLDIVDELTKKDIKDVTEKLDNQHRAIVRLMPK